MNHLAATYQRNGKWHTIRTINGETVTLTFNTYDELVSAVRQLEAVG